MHGICYLGKLFPFDLVMWVLSIVSRENLSEDMLQEPDEIAMKRKQCQEMLRVHQQAFRELDELFLVAEIIERGYSLSDPTGLPKIHGLPPSSLYPTNSSGDYCAASPTSTKSRKSCHSGNRHQCKLMQFLMEVDGIHARTLSHG